VRVRARVCARVRVRAHVIIIIFIIIIFIIIIIIIITIMEMMMIIINHHHQLLQTHEKLIKFDKIYLKSLKIIKK